MSECLAAANSAVAFTVDESGYVVRAHGASDGLETESGLLAMRRDVPDWYEACAHRLANLAKLDENWDSYGARRVHPYSIEFAKQALLILSRVTGIEAPLVTASPDGYAAMTWDWPDSSRSLDLEVLPSNRFRFVYTNHENESLDSEGTVNDLRLIALLLTNW